MDHPIVKIGLALVLAIAILSLINFLPEQTAPPDVKGAVKKMPSGVKYITKKVGKGSRVAFGKRILVHYTGWVLKGTRSDGTPKVGASFDSSRKKGRPFPVNYGPRARVIRGWIHGLKGMRAGGRRILIIPSRLGYGKRGFPPRIPPNADLVFDVEVVSVH